MKVVTRKTEAFEVRLGDIFRNSQGDYYFLAKTSDKHYEMVSLTGSGIWNNDVDFNSFKKHISNAVNGGRLIHYPQEMYQLMIEKV